MPQLVKQPNEGQQNQVDILGILQRLAQGDPNNPIQNWQGTANINNGGNLPGGNNQTIMGEIAQREQEQSKLMMNLVKNSPILKASYKAVEKYTTDKVNEALQFNVPPAEILQMAHEQAGVPMPPPPGQNQSLLGHQAPPPTEQINTNILNQLLEMSQPKGFLGRFQQNVAKTTGNNTDADRVATLLGIQKGAGQEPLQKGEKEKQEIIGAYKVAEELAKKGSPDALTPEASAKFNLMIDGDKAVKEAAQFLSDDKGVVFSAPSFLKSQKSRQYESAVKRMIRNKLRLESGATIGDKEVDEEYKKYKVGFTDSKETIRRKLQPLNEFYEGTLNVADPTGVHRQRATGGKPKTSGSYADYLKAIGR